MSKIEVNQISSQCGSTLTIGQSGDTIQLACGATQTGFGRTGTVNWDTTAKTASFTAVSGNGYFVNTTSGAVTVTLPAGSAGDIVSLADYTNTWQTNSVTITPNGSDKIGGVNENAILNTEGQSVTFVYVDATEGWKNVQDSTSNVTGNAFIVATGGTITTCGNCKIHTFTGPGTFCVSLAAVCAADNVVSHLVVAGGGGGASGSCGEGGGAGGAGGFREVVSPSSPYVGSPLNGYCTPTNRITVTASPYPISVGGGGVGGDGTPECGSQGSNSIFSTITSTGGGNGGNGNANPNPVSGGSGGSGGGGGSYSTSGGGSGNTPPVTPSQGNNGGNGGPGSPGYAGGGGGGATASGGNASSTTAGSGGAGAASSINGTPTTRAGGGGGGTHPQGTPGSGGSGGGGDGAGTNLTPATPGTINTGGGGGGAGGTQPSNGGSGGSGIVIIRYRYQ